MCTAPQRSARMQIGRRDFKTVKLCKWEAAVGALNLNIFQQRSDWSGFLWASHVNWAPWFEYLIIMQMKPGAAGKNGRGNGPINSTRVGWSSRSESETIFYLLFWFDFWNETTQIESRWFVGTGASWDEDAERVSGKRLAFPSTDGAGGSFTLLSSLGSCFERHWRILFGFLFSYPASFRNWLTLSESTVLTSKSGRWIDSIIITNWKQWVRMNSTSGAGWSTGSEFLKCPAWLQILNELAT